MQYSKASSLHAASIHVIEFMTSVVMIQITF